MAGRAVSGDGLSLRLPVAAIASPPARRLPTDCAASSRASLAPPVPARIAAMSPLFPAASSESVRRSAFSGGRTSPRSCAA